MISEYFFSFRNYNILDFTSLLIHIIILSLKIYVILKKNTSRIWFLYFKRLSILSRWNAWMQFLLQLSNCNCDISSLSCNSSINTKFHKLVLIISLHIYSYSKLFSVLEFVFFEDTALVYMCNKCDKKVRNDREIYFFKQAFYLFYKTLLLKKPMNCVSFWCYWYFTPHSL